MIQIKLINMPFADISIPSIALTQLKEVTEAAYGSKVNIQIIYLNHEFGKYLGIDHYRFISNGAGSNNSGFGDWFFRQEAFPEMEDNTEEYMIRYAHLIGMGYLKDHGGMLLEKRNKLEGFFESLINKYELAHVDIIGFTSMFMQQVAILSMAKKLKKINPKIITVIGGANCETPMGEEIAKHSKDIDYVFSGGSLISFPKLVGNLLESKKSSNESINGVFTRTNNSATKNLSKAQILVAQDGGVKTLGPIGDEMPINACVPLNYDSFLDSFEALSLNGKANPYLLFETSRGCWWGAKAHCTFCGLNGGGMTYRAMSSDLAIKMLNELFERYGQRVKHFSCVDNIIPKEYIKNVFPYLKNNNRVTMFYEVKADLTSEQLEILAKTGVVEVQPGIESLSTSTLKLMKKGTSAYNNIRFLMDCVKYSISAIWNLLIGFPGEKESVYEKYYRDLPLLYHLQPPQGIFPVRFDRYSPYFNDQEKYNLDLQPLDYYSLIYPYSESDIAKIAYYFADQNIESEYMIYTAKWLNRLSKRVEEWRQLWSKFGEGFFPKLFTYTQGDKHFVFDSRSGKAKNIPLTNTDYEILSLLKVKKTFEGILSKFDNQGKENLLRILDNLKSLGLIFEEDGSFISITFQEEPTFTKPSGFH